ncbi:WhiB family transcriptional regulator [Motilibacter aurantiacus]|uniref:WhiB family transcriptional regulator n=1 Tax=Motilibacter aurantiacus TaxID=2714955 RepID=UPI00140D9249|nr:WhiB family transcriptional regulator [Motilibacter aurantiacus]NHC43992.1 WhiB family transcriptional regulator [Motilibacter aurantiacus]
MAELSRLPGPNADLWDWQLSGACRRTDPDVFFHPDGERGPRRRARELAAKTVCASCPVIVQCAKHALAVREPYGVWGGMSEDEREAVYASARGPVPSFPDSSAVA